MRLFRYIITFALLQLFSLTAIAGPTDANLGGHVLDGETGEHMAYCLVAIKDTRLATMTDASGHYIFRDLAPGEYVVEAAFTGYKAESHKVKLEKGRSTEQNFSLMPDAFMLDQVVVTSSKSQIKRRESPALVSVLPGDIFTQVSACSLADGLSFQPGVRVENDCQNCGFTQVRINGLDGHYSQILMNSRPVFSALTGVYGLEQIPANMIERVEVMRGGGSALFGSSAVGGTINIITKDPMVNSARLSHTLMAIGPSGSMDNNTTINASVVTDNSRAGTFIYGQSRNRDGYDHNGDGFTEIAQLKTQTIGARAFLRPGDNSRISGEYHTTHEYRRGGDNLKLQPHQAQIAEQTDHNIHAAELTFDLWPRQHRDHLSVFAATQVTRRQSYYGSDYDPDAYGRTSDAVITAGSQWTHSFDRLIFMPSELVAGLEYSYNRLHDVTLGYDHDLLQKVNIYSAYLQNEWRDSRWGFLIGARLDKHSLIHNPIISPRVNLRFSPSDRLNFRVSYSTGFRSPQAYDEDFHVAVVGRERVVTVLAPGLKQESSQSVSASGDIYHRFGGVQTNLLIEGFFTDLRDVFALRQIEQTTDAGYAILERYNGSGARVLGLNIEVKVYFNSKYDVQAGITLQQSHYKQPEYWSDDPDVAPTRKMFRTPNTYGYLTGNAQILPCLKASVSGTYTGRMLVQHLQGSGTPVDVARTTRRFLDASLKLTYTVKAYNRVTVDVSAGVTNIFNAYQSDFDLGPMRDSGYIYGPALPRSITAGISLSI